MLRLGSKNESMLATLSGVVAFCLLLLPMGHSSFLSNKAFAQSSHPVKYISLSVGIYHDEKVPNAPKRITTAGKYKSLMRLQYNDNAKVIRFDPKKVGVGTVLIKDPRTDRVIYEYRVDVKKTNLHKVAREIRSLLNNIDGISIKIVNNKVIVDGEILLPKDMSRIHSVVKQYEQAASLVTLSPLAQKKIAEFIERDIGNPEITVRAVNGKFILEGYATDEKERTRAVILAKTYVPDVVVDEAVADQKVLERKTDVVINLIKLKPPPEQEPKKTIQLVVHYVELQKDYTKGFRFQWMPDIGDGSSLQYTTGGQGGVGGAITTITGTISNLLPKLNWAKQHGHARVLQSSSLIVQDGENGILNSFTKVPFQTIGENGQPNTDFERAGLRADITPQIIGARSDSLELTMKFAVSSLIGITSQGPMTSNKEMQTKIVVRSGQSAAVGGLISNDTGTGYNRLPANVSRNPLISLYASKDFRRNQSQFVVFITPIIKSSASAGAEKIKQKFRLRQ